MEGSTSTQSSAGHSRSQSEQRKTNARNRGASYSKEESEGLRKVFMAELKDILWAEEALVKALPKMAEKATSAKLVSAINNHIRETEMHVKRLEEVFSILGEKAKGEKCEAMKGLISEAEDMASEMPEGVVRDAGIIASAQKVEHYEIAAYGTLCAFAETLGESQVAALLEKTLEEEKMADEKLSDIAMNSVNEDAADAQESGRGNRAQ